jgi:hypothetical protein
MKAQFSRKGVFGAAMLVPVMALTLAAGAQPAAAAPGEARLNRIIQQALRADGPLFTPTERALIERKCGYAPGQWDGYDHSISNGVLECKNGRRVDDPEVRAMMEVAGPRIGRRVSTVMARADVQAEIGRVASEAAQRALRNLNFGRGR